MYPRLDMSGGYWDGGCRCWLAMTPGVLAAREIAGHHLDGIHGLQGVGY